MPETEIGLLNLTFDDEDDETSSSVLTPAPRVTGTYTLLQPPTKKTGPRSAAYV